MHRVNPIVYVLFLAIACSACQKDEVRSTNVYACTYESADSSLLHPRKEVYQHLLDGIVASGVPGIQMSVVGKTTGHWYGTAGQADIKTGVDLESCHLTRVGSTVKTFTATTIMLLQEEGKLDLDQQLSAYLDPDVLEGLENADKASIRQLLQHSSGIYNYIQNLQFQTESLNDLVKEWQAEDLLAYARGKKAYFEPGANVTYSNTNYILLGMVISEIEGKPFYEVFEEKIFRPLGLGTTQFAANDPVPGGLVRGYVDFYSNLNLIQSSDYSGWDYYTADGGLLSNARDLSHFMRALFEEGLLSNASLEEMQKGQVPTYLDPGFYDIKYGLGIFEMETPWGKAYFHSGDAIGYYAMMAYFPEHETSIAWAVNGNYGKIDQFVSSKEAMDKVFKAVFE